MPTAADILRKKAIHTSAEFSLDDHAPPGSGVVCVGKMTTVLEAAERMNEHRIGAVAVVDDHGDLIGMFTERDVLTRIVARRRDPSATRVGEAMTAPAIFCNSDTTVGELRELMRTKRVRHLPVVDNGRLEGMLSIGDLNAAEVRVMAETITYLERYMHSM